MNSKQVKAEAGPRTTRYGGKGVVGTGSAMVYGRGAGDFPLPLSAFTSVPDAARGASLPMGGDRPGHPVVVMSELEAVQGLPHSLGAGYVAPQSPFYHQVPQAFRPHGVSKVDTRPDMEEIEIHEQDGGGTKLIDI